MAEIQCPSCGHTNPDHLEECANCHTQLPPASPESGAPDWLSSLRGEDDDDIYREEEDPADWPDEAADVSAEAAERLSRLGADDPDAGAPPQPEETGPPPDAEASLEQPDWLQDLMGQDPPESGGESGAPQKAEPGASDPASSPEDDAPESQSEPEESPPEAPEEAPPAAALENPEAEPGAEPHGAEPAEDIPDWLQELGPDAEPDAPDEAEDFPEAEPADEVPDWLQEMTSGGDEGEDREAEPLPDWLEEPEAGETSPVETPEDVPAAAAFEDPESEPEPEAEPHGAEPADEVPDWLQELRPDAEPADPLPDWLEEPEAGETPPVETPEDVPAAAAFEDPQSEPEPEAEPHGAEPADEVPDWLGAMAPGAERGEAPGDEPADEAPDTGEGLPDWLTSFGGEDVEPAPEPEQEDAPTDASGGEPEGEPLPEVPGFDLVDSDPEEDRPEPVEEEDAPEWLAGFVDEIDTPVQKPEEGDEEAEDWLAGFVDPPESEDAPEAEDEKDILPSWVSKPGVADPDYPTPRPKSKPEQAPWLDEFDAETPEAVPAGDPDADSNLPEIDPDQEEVPDWLTTALGEVEEDADDELPLDLDDIEPLVETEEDEDGREDEEGEAAPDKGLEDWLSQYDSLDEPEPEEEEQEQEQEEELPEWLMDVGAAGAFAQEEEEKEDEEIPEWLQELEDKTPAAEAGEGEGEELAEETDAEVWMPGAAENPALSLLSEAGDFDEDLAPGELPEWLKAMRPIDASEPGVMETGEVDTGSVERVGPLAGLRGVLSAEPTAAQAGSPPSYSVRLQLTDDQQRKADQLQKMVASEVEPGPARREAVLSEQRVLRWIIAALLFLTTVIPLAVPGRFSELPPKPAEMDAVTPLITSLSADSAVLIIFDYQPGLSGEIDAAASGIVDHVMIQHARLALVATSPIGPALGERLVQRVGAEHAYAYGVDYVNLGYIPGAATGLQFFAGDPVAASPVGYDDLPFWALVDQAGSSPWNRPALQGVDGLEDFQLTLLLSDDPDTIRRWIEQAGGRMRTGSLVVVASAQAEPLVRPYFDAGNGQVAALVPGLRGGAAYEGFLQREGPARAAWDSVGLTSMLALVLILGVGSYNLYLAWNEREIMRGGNG